MKRKRSGSGGKVNRHHNNRVAPVCVQLTVKHLDFPPSYLRTRRSRVRVPPGAPLFLNNYRSYFFLILSSEKTLVPSGSQHLQDRCDAGGKWGWGFPQGCELGGWRVNSTGAITHGETLA